MVGKPIHRSAQGLLVLLSVALTGCAMQSGSYGPPVGGTVHGSQGTPLDANLSGFLAQAPAGSVFNVPQSPWGENVEVMVEQAYYAASGRECRQLRVISAQNRISQQVACDTAQGWEAKRLIIDTAAGGNR